MSVTVHLHDTDYTRSALEAVGIDPDASNSRRGASKHPSGTYTVELSHSISEAVLELRRNPLPAKCIKTIEFAWGRDESLSEDKVKNGMFTYRGADIVVRWFHNSSADGSWREADIRCAAPNREVFEELVRMLGDENFTTEWFERIERRPVEEWEARRRPTLQERLTTVRREAGRKASPVMFSGYHPVAERKFLNARMG